MISSRMAALRISANLFSNPFLKSPTAGRLRNLSSPPANKGAPPRYERVLRVSPKKKEKESQRQTMLSKFLGPKPMPERHSAAWYGEMLLLCTVFGITGSSTMFLVSSAAG
jgi:hypothetical protein